MSFTLALDNPIVAAIKALYGTAKAIDSYIDDLIESMKKSVNRTIEASGRVLEAAKFGFGLGYAVSVAVIAIGQLILGHPFLAVATVVTSPVNPVAMTCAAIGAIYFGWAALSDDERNAIIQRVGQGLEMGAELIKSIVAFVVGKCKELLSGESIAEFKRFISDATSLVGRTLADVTRSIADRAGAAYDVVTDKLKRKPEEPGELPRLPL
ncbi:hypothetical protein [Piscinibacter defluvii]|uniref:hypothetical protein n=1 Tax=Piscinibacter defluvii TaxID=1796922 RepID=UPI000FDEAE02|nr:hypothetical protein [Piscinibacter defluvii]